MYRGNALFSCYTLNAIATEQDIFECQFNTLCTERQGTVIIYRMESEAAFEQVFKTHFKALHSYALQ